MNAKNNTLQRTIMEETGGIGVDIVVDNEVNTFELLSSSKIDSNYVNVDGRRQ